MSEPMIITRRALRGMPAQPARPVRPREDAGTAAPGRTARRSRRGGFLGELLLWAAAAAGLVCIVLVVLAMTAHITLILFRTGSMAPTIPTGSVAVVQQIPAAQVHVGDVVTVDRAGLLPVTHRVRAIAPGSSSEQRLLTLRGDANAQDDAAPYAVTTVRIVRFSVPGLSPFIVLLGDPFVIGGLTVGAAALIVWAFWPREEDGRRRGGRARGSATIGGSDLAEADPPSQAGA